MHFIVCGICLDCSGRTLSTSTSPSRTAAAAAAAVEGAAKVQASIDARIGADRALVEKLFGTFVECNEDMQRKRERPDDELNLGYVDENPGSNRFKLVAMTSLTTG